MSKPLGQWFHSAGGGDVGEPEFVGQCRDKFVAAGGEVGGGAIFVCLARRVLPLQPLVVPGLVNVLPRVLVFVNAVFFVRWICVFGL